MRRRGTSAYGSTEFTRVVMKCLEKEPTQRFQSARQLAHALKRLQLPAWSEADAAEWWHARRSEEQRDSA